MDATPSTAQSLGSPPSAADFFEALGPLSPLRVISQCGPSTFEAIADFGPHGFDRGFMNAITPAYHWHLRTDGLGHVRSHDTIHGRSGRRVLFFELREHAGTKPFLQIYLYRAKGEDFDEERLKLFDRIHTRYAEGVALAPLPENSENAS